MKNKMSYTQSSVRANSNALRGYYCTLFLSDITSLIHRSKATSCTFINPEADLYSPLSRLNGFTLFLTPNLAFNLTNLN